MTVTISEIGAEMQSLQGANGIEYLWNGDPEYWGGRAPNLFPIVGGLRGEQATSANGPITLPKHGFIRHTPTELVEASDTRAVYRYVDNEETRKGYPFGFCWEVAYELRGDELFVTYTVTNTGNVPLPYCVGGHPAFRVPLVEGEAFDDTALEWEFPETIDCPRFERGGISSHGYNRLVTDKQSIMLSHTLFRPDALIMENLRSHWLQLRGKSGHGVRVTSDMPYWGVWSPLRKDSPFVCLEPWTGMATRSEEDDVFEHKTGMTVLPVGETASHCFSIRIF